MTWTKGKDMTHKKALASAIDWANIGDTARGVLWLDIAREIRISTQIKQRAADDAARRANDFCETETE